MSFWDTHGILFLLGLMFFPRITVWFFSAITGGLVFWLGVLVVPRVCIIFIAIYSYVDTNPSLVILSVLWCLFGELAEKCGAGHVFMHFEEPYEPPEPYFGDPL
jgi:hypothetical protein